MERPEGGEAMNNKQVNAELRCFLYLAQPLFHLEVYTSTHNRTGIGH